MTDYQPSDYPVSGYANMALLWFFLGFIFPIFWFLALARGIDAIREIDTYPWGPGRLRGIGKARFVVITLGIALALTISWLIHVYAIAIIIRVVQSHFGG